MRRLRHIVQKSDIGMPLESVNDDVQPRSAKTIFWEAVERYSPDQWPAFLDEACGNDSALRQRVEILLAAHERADRLTRFAEAAVRAAEPSIVLPDHHEGPGTHIGPYRLIEKLGSGGMGVVFLAEQTEPVQRQVALKIIRPGMDTERVIARFEAERQALAVMDHPNVAKVLDAGTTESGRPYFVMERVHGQSIIKYCDEQKLPVRERLELFLPVCQAVQHAHQKGIIHRDLKPSNILVAEFDGRPVPKVIDFGVAKAIDQSAAQKQLSTQHGQIVGTLEYMSPEQARLNQNDVDTRSDVYSLGAVLYELLTGITPFDRERLYSAAFDQALHILDSEDPVKPSIRLSGSDSLPSIAALRVIEPQRLTGLIRGELDWIVMKALEKERSRRYESASGLGQDIDHYLHNEPVSAGPPSAAYRFRKFARRNRQLLLVLALVSLALLIGTAASLYQAFRATNAERLAEARLEEVQRQQAALQQQQTTLQAALDTADQERKTAEGNLRVALDSVNEMLTRLASDKLQHVSPQLSTVRVEMFTRAQLLLEQLAQVNPTKQHIRRQLADGYRHLGQLADVLGRHEDGEQALRKAIGLSEELYQTNSADTADLDLCTLQANCYLALGALLHDLGRLDESKAAYRHLAELADSPLANYLRDDDRQRWIGMSHQNVAHVLQAQNNFDAAEKEYKEALAVQEPLSQRNSSREDRRHLAITLFNFGGMCHQQGQCDDSVVATQRAIAMFTGLLEKEPSNTNLKQLLADAYNNLGVAYLTLNDNEKAVGAFRELVQILRTLVTDFPSVPDYQDELAIGYGNMAGPLRKLGNRDEAIQVTQRAIETLRPLVEQHPAVPSYPLHLASYTRNLGNYCLDDQSWDPAMAHYREALRNYEAAFAQRPDILEYAENLALGVQSLMNAHWKRGKSNGGQLDAQSSREYVNDVEHLAQILVALFNANYGTNRTELAMTSTNLAKHIAWNLVIAPDPGQRDPELALELAAALSKAQPDDGRLSQIRGVAHFRKQEWREAIDMLEKSMGARGGADGCDLFVLAMCEHHLGNSEAARAGYAEGIRWMESLDKVDSGLLQLRDDAARLLEIKPEQHDIGEAGDGASPSTDSL